MLYASQQEMVDRFGEQELIELTDRANTGAIDAAVIGKVLLDANAEIDSYLQGNFSLPLVTVPPRLIEIAADLARYKLYGARTTDQVRNRYTDSIKYLQQLVLGNVSLGLDAAGEVVKIASVATVVSSNKVFGRNGDRGF